MYYFVMAFYSLQRKNTFFYAASLSDVFYDLTGPHLWKAKCHAVFWGSALGLVIIELYFKLDAKPAIWNSSSLF